MDLISSKSYLDYEILRKEKMRIILAILGQNPYLINNYYSKTKSSKLEINA